MHVFQIARYLMPIFIEKGLDPCTLEKAAVLCIDNCRGCLLGLVRSAVMISRILIGRVGDH